MTVVSNIVQLAGVNTSKDQCGATGQQKWRDLFSNICSLIDRKANYRAPAGVILSSCEKQVY